MSRLGTPIVFDVPPITQPVNGVQGRIRFRFRRLTPARLYVRHASTTREFCIGIAEDGSWYPVYESGRNERTERTP